MNKFTNVLGSFIKLSTVKILNQKIEDVYLIESEPFIDERGAFRRHFCAEEFVNRGISSSVQQANISENKYAKTLRGFHYQISPFSEGKTLSCLRGSIYDVIVDLRVESKTYMQWISFELTESNRLSIHIPPGCANAFLTLENNCLIHYYCSNAYHPESERGIRYNDPVFNFKWPFSPEIISDKDKSHPDYKV